MQLFLSHFFQSNEFSIEALQQAGSDRKYYRVIFDNKSYIACENKIVKENETFFYFSKYFYDRHIPVPQVFSMSDCKSKYLLEDLGNIALLDLLLTEGFNDKVYELYKLALTQLANMQTIGQEIDFDKCYIAKCFDRQAVMSDLNYFKYYFLDLHHLDYDKMGLNNEFEKLSIEIELSVIQLFMYRDFQGRNIMIHQMKPFFIDYQGGMKGPPQYDVASLLWQAKAALPQTWKTSLYTHYKIELKKHLHFNDDDFDYNYSSILLVRLLQVMGAYGLRGLIEKRPHFLSSIYYGLKNIAEWKSLYNLKEYPILMGILNQLSDEKIVSTYSHKQMKHKVKLAIRIHSFSYKKGIPEDLSGNGGGFVFDCRGILNPGRFDEYKKLTGRDKPVIEFLEQKTKMNEFFLSVKQLVDINITDYIERGFENLMISFGCTGGQHRSVYAADAMAKYIQEKYGIACNLVHIEQEAKQWQN